MTSIRIQALEFENAAFALQHTEAAGTGRAIVCGGKSLVVEERELERIETAGVEFALLSDHEKPDGSWRIMTFPVND